MNQLSLTTREAICLIRDFPYFEAFFDDEAIMEGTREIGFRGTQMENHRYFFDVFRIRLRIVSLALR